MKFHHLEYRETTPDGRIAVGAVGRLEAGDDQTVCLGELKEFVQRELNDSVPVEVPNTVELDAEYQGKIDRLRRASLLEMQAEAWARKHGVNLEQDFPTDIPIFLAQADGLPVPDRVSSAPMELNSPTPGLPIPGEPVAPPLMPPPTPIASAGMPVVSMGRDGGD